MKTIITIYPELTDSAVVATNCVQCNKKMKVTLKASQTLNPFNKNKDGTVKTREDIYVELSDNINKQVKNFEHNHTCIACIKKDKNLPVYDLPLYVIYNSFYTISEPFYLYRIDKINECSWRGAEYKKGYSKSDEHHWNELNVTYGIYKGRPYILDKCIKFNNEEEAVCAFHNMMSIWEATIDVAVKGIAGKHGKFENYKPLGE